MLRDYQAKGIDDIRAAFSEGFRRVLFVAPCGSGKTRMMVYMDEQARLRGNRTLFVVHRRELLEQAKKAGCENVVSVQALVKNPPREIPDVLVFDEAHHATAGSWQKILAMFPEAWVVGLTATPVRLNGQGLGSVFEVLVRGAEAQELIEQGFLSSYQYYAPPMQADLSGLKIRAGDYQSEQVAALMDKPQIIGDAIEHYLKLAKGKQAIAYCASISHSIHTAEEFCKAGVYAMHVDGTTPNQKRDQIMDDFKQGKIQVLCNVDLISEGFDVPNMEAVILLRPTASLALYIQQSMRPLRPMEGKQAIILDHVGNVLRHGLPDEPREWELNPPKKRRKPKAGSGATVRQCPWCYGVHRPTPHCLWCGYEYPIQSREIEMTEGELQEYKKGRRIEVGAAQTIGDLMRIARERKYKLGWVYHQAKLKGIRT